MELNSTTRWLTVGALVIAVLAIVAGAVFGVAWLSLRLWP